MFSVENQRLFFYPISEDYSLFQIKMGLKVLILFVKTDIRSRRWCPASKLLRNKKNGFSHVPCVIRMSFREPFLRLTSRLLLHKRMSRKIPWRQCIPSIKRSKRFWMRANLSGIDLPMRLAPFTEGDAPDRLITGTPTSEEVSELRDEGIEVLEIGLKKDRSTN